MTRLLTHIPMSAVMPDRAGILRRMRYHSRKTVLSDTDEQSIEQGIAMAGATGRPAGVYGLFPISERSDTGLAIGGVYFESKSLARLLAKSDSAVLMAATAGDGPAAEIDELTKSGRLSDAVVLDAVVSEMTDHCLDYMTGLLKQEWANKGLRPTAHRYSPGYGDLDIKLQGAIHTLLDAGRLGIAITETCMLLPLKSVFAILGIERNEKDDLRRS
jgi:hypothetical protein